MKSETGCLQIRNEPGANHIVERACGAIPRMHRRHARIAVPSQTRRELQGTFDVLKRPHCTHRHSQNPKVRVSSYTERNVMRRRRGADFTSLVEGSVLAGDDLEHFEGVHGDGSNSGVEAERQSSAVRRHRLVQDERCEGRARRAHDVDAGEEQLVVDHDVEDAHPGGDARLNLREVQPQRVGLVRLHGHGVGEAVERAGRGGGLVDRFGVDVGRVAEPGDGGVRAQHVHRGPGREQRLVRRPVPIPAPHVRLHPGSVPRRRGARGHPLDRPHHHVQIRILAHIIRVDVQLVDLNRRHHGTPMARAVEAYRRRAVRDMQHRILVLAVHAHAPPGIKRIHQRALQRNAKNRPDVARFLKRKEKPKKPPDRQPRGKHGAIGCNELSN
jgi:hypothetical protein